MTPGLLIRTLGVAVLTFAVSAASAHAAQRSGMVAQDRAGRGAASRSPRELAAMLDSYVAVQAQSALSLDNAHYPEFLTRLRALQEVRRRNQQGHNQILQDLRRMTGAQAQVPADESLIRERLKALREHDDRAREELRRAQDAVDEVLDPTQQARFRIFEEGIERRKLDLVMRARQAAAARRGNIQP
jgi:succinate dehydrogenase/fumarate reductase flavoprotein subunit